MSRKSRGLLTGAQGITKYVKGGERGLMEALLTKGPMTGVLPAPLCICLCIWHPQQRVVLIV